MPRRKVTMQPLGATKAFRPIRVSSSSCPNPQESSANLTSGLVDYSDHSISTQDKFVAGLVEGGNYSDDFYNYFF